MIGQQNKVSVVGNDTNKKYEKSKKKKLKLPNIILPPSCSKYVSATLHTADVFFRHSSIHGTQYIAEFEDPDFTEKTPKYVKPIIKIVWAILCILGIGCCIYMMDLVYQRYRNTPTVTSIETSTYPVYMLQFPAVTICNINKVYSPNTRNFTEILISQGVHNDTIHEFYRKLAVLVTPEYIDGVYLQIYVILENMGYPTDKLMRELVQPCELLLKTCLWLGSLTPCEKLFRLVKTSEGFCCSFNFRALREEFDTFDINNISSAFAPPYYVMGAGQSVGLSVLLDAEESSYLAVTRNFYGLEIIVHDPNEMPPIVVTAIVQPEQDISIAISPSVVVSQPDIRDLPMSKRLCYFEDEKKLRTTNKYSFQSCMWECRLDTILNRCGCIPFYYPETQLEAFTKIYRQCSLRDSKCLRTHRYVFSSIQPPENTTGFNNSAHTGMECKCYPNCSENQYLTDALIGQRFNAKLISPVFGEIDMKTYSSLHVFFKDLTCIQYRRDIYMTWDSLFSSAGGIFGLCVGGSILSIAEIFYFFSFKMYIYLISKKSKKQEETIQQSKNINVVNSSTPPPHYSTKFPNYRSRQRIVW